MVLPGYCNRHELPDVPEQKLVPRLSMACKRLCSYAGSTSGCRNRRRPSDVVVSSCLPPGTRLRLVICQASLAGSFRDFCIRQRPVSLRHTFTTPSSPAVAKNIGWLAPLPAATQGWPRKASTSGRTTAPARGQRYFNPSVT